MIQSQLKRGDIEQPNPSRVLLTGARKDMFRRMFQFGGGIFPYFAWLLPLMERLLTPKRDLLAPGLMDLRNDIRSDLKQHIAILQSTQIDVTPAIEEQQLRLERLEEQTSELNHIITNLSEDQLNLADQVRSMAGWVRNSAIAGLFLLSILFILKLVQAIHGMGH